MKSNWKFAAMCFAALAMVACDTTPNPENGENNGEEEAFVSLVNVRDNSVAEWDNLPAEYVATATVVDGALLTDLKSVKVYADEMYINFMFEFAADQFSADDKAWTPFHVYLNADNSNATGGYGDQFADANSEILLEGALFSGGEAIDFNPAVFKWWGPVGENGWLWTDPNVEHDDSDGWGAVVATGALPIGQSQLVGTNVFEVQLLRELIPAQFADEFGIGFDIQKNWNSSGVLPQGPADENGNIGKVNKIQVKIDYAK